MKIVRILNNNVVQAVDNLNQEIIVTGRGLGFNKKVGDKVEKSKIEKTFVLSDEQLFNAVYTQLSQKEIDLVFEIIAYAEKELEQQFQSHIYLALADHIHFAIERNQSNIVLTNPLAWSVKNLYKEEYKIGLKILDMIEEQLDIKLDKEEAASIALHILNAKKDEAKLEHTIQQMKMVEDILRIVTEPFKVSFNEDSISYQRFITHLQYFADRVSKHITNNDNDDFLYKEVKNNYNIAFGCTVQIENYVKDRYQYNIGEDEKVYLTIHIHKLLKNSLN